MTYTIRQGTPSDLVSIMKVFELALLAVDIDRIISGLHSNEREIFIAERGSHIIGAIAIDNSEIYAIAVRPKYRRNGVGTALIGAAMNNFDDLWAEFDGRVSPFYRSLGFSMTSLSGDRYTGHLPAHHTTD